MSSHYGSSHYGGSHYASSHYGRGGQIVVPIVPGGGISDALVSIRKKRGKVQRNIRHLLLVLTLFLGIQEDQYDRRQEDDPDKTD